MSKIDMLLNTILYSVHTLTLYDLLNSALCQIKKANPAPGDVRVCAVILTSLFSCHI